MDKLLLTSAERSNFRLTGRSDEVDALCQAFTARWPEMVRSFIYGHSAEGRPLRGLIASRCGTLSASGLRSRKIPVLMLQAGIHPGESDGKDAGFIALRELLSTSPGLGLLDHVALLFVPAFNVDGHERFGRWNRPNQNGPEETGWRTTSQNLNLNRDYTKAEAPEMQAMLGLINEWDPLVCADLHVTDGADFEPDVSFQVEPVNQGDPRLRAIGLELRNELIAELASQGSIPLPFYPDLVEADNPASGFMLTIYSPRFSTGYFPQRNRFTVLVETHSWKPYATRIRVTRNTIWGLAKLVANHGATWLRAAHEADIAASELGGTEVALDYAAGWREPMPAGHEAAAAQSGATETIEFRGYAYRREPSPISGILVTTYDPATPQIWKVPFRNRAATSLVVTAPRGGYAVPPGYAEAIGAKLSHHGIEFTRLPAARRFPDTRSFRATNAQFSPGPFEGRMRASIDGAWHEEPVELGTGTLIVPIAQARARLLMALLEPKAPDSFLSWGFFNACFEQKELMEPYVAEKIAQQMLTSDAALRTSFNRRLSDEPIFAASPSARLDFFLRRHASWDDRYMRYPVLRLESALVRPA